jgi:ribonuclease P protein component
MREIARELLKEHSSGFTVVVRALPGAAEINWANLQNELRSSVATGVKKTAG